MTRVTQGLPWLIPLRRVTPGRNQKTVSPSCADVHRSGLVLVVRDFYTGR